MISSSGASLQSVTPSSAAMLGESRSVATTAEAKWAKLLSTGARLQGVSSVSDVRVAPFVQSTWGQDQYAYNSPNCYNYYTPNNDPCGCVATATAQIMRYFEWPKTTFLGGQYTYNCTVDGATIALTTQGGVYDWSLMPLKPSSSNMTTAKCQAIGKLTSDIGIICAMQYSSGGSGTGGYMPQFVYPKFNYSNVMTYSASSDLSDSKDLRNALLSNFDAKLPVMVSIDGSDGGHAIVGDGYGYSDNTLYIHLNYGWSGTGNAWYAPPSLDAGSYRFSVLDGFVYNIYTNQTANSVICSGRVLTSSGAPVAGATVTAKLSGKAKATATTNEKGIYALYLTAGTYSLTATYGSSSALANNVTVRACTTMNLCEESSGSYGSYWSSSSPSVGNVWGKDLTLTGLASVEEPVLSPADCVFWPTTNVTISCATAGATIHYNLNDEEDPTEASPIYSGPITLTATTVLKARAFKSGSNPSAVSAATYTYDETRDAPAGDYFANPIEISGVSGSYVVSDNSRYTLEENEPFHTLENYSYYNQARTIWYEWTAPGSGTISFTTKCYKTTTSGGYVSTSRKPTYLAVYQGDNLATATRKAFSTSIESSGYTTTVSLEVSAGESYRIVGMVGNESYTGEFTLTWSGDLTITRTATSTTEVPVPYTWLDGYFPGTRSADAYETLANRDSDGDGFTNWQEYVLDTDPTDSGSAFTASIRMEGTTPVVEWSHTNATIKALGYRYVPKGRESLTDGAWTDFDPAGHHFFKVVVEPSSP